MTEAPDPLQWRMYVVNAEFSLITLANSFAHTAVDKRYRRAAAASSYIEPAAKSGIG